MKIIELLDEGLGSAVAGLAKGANEFVKGAGGPDVLGAIDDHLDHNSELFQKYFSKYNTRSIDRNKPIDEQFDNVMKTMYGDKLTRNIKEEWANAINQGDVNGIQTLVDKTNNEKDPPFQDTAMDNGKLKKSTAGVVRDLADIGKWAIREGTPLNLMGINNPESSEEEPDSDETPADDENQDDQDEEDERL